MQRLDDDVSRLIEVFESKTLKDIIAIHKNLVKKREKDLSSWESSYPHVHDYDVKELHYYITYVYLIANSFGDIDNDTLRRVSEIATKIIEPYRHFLNEHYEDEKEDHSEKAFVLNHQQLKGLMALENLLDSKAMHVFWERLDIYTNQMIEGFTLAKTRITDDSNTELPQAYDDESFKKIAIGLNAYSKIIIPIIAGVTGKYHKMESIESALDHYFIAHKIFLDLKCWKRDLQKGRYTKLLSEVILENEEAFIGEDGIHEKAIMKVLYAGGYDEKHLLKANRIIEKALFESSGNEPCQRALRSFQNRVNLLLYDFRTLKGLSKRTYTAKTYENKAIKDTQSSIEKAWQWLTNQAEGQYPELTHWGTFLHHYGFTAKEQVIPGNVYYRTYMLNILEDLNASKANKGTDSLKSLLKKERDYVFANKHAYSDYGWGHFPMSPELPPDIGTLAEIIYCALEAGDQAVIDETKKVIDFILKNNRRSDGAILSWITDKKKDEFLRNSKSVHCIYIRMLLKRIYKKPIVVNVAAFLEALARLDKDAYQTAIEAGYAWIMSQQTEAGYWKYHYFTGQMMGISKIFSLSKTLETPHEKLKKTGQYLLKSQNANGSWGQEEGDPKETAYALMALSDAVDMGILDFDEIIDKVEKGSAYLLKMQTESGYWHGCDFAEIQIKNLSTEPADLIEYRSATLTTGLALKALSKSAHLSKSNKCSTTCS